MKQIFNKQIVNKLQTQQILALVQIRLTLLPLQTQQILRIHPLQTSQVVRIQLLLHQLQVQTIIQHLMVMLSITLIRRLMNISETLMLS